MPARPTNDGTLGHAQKYQKHHMKKNFEVTKSPLQKHLRSWVT